MSVVPVVRRGCEKHYLRVVVECVREYAVLDVTSENSLLGEWNRVFLGVNSPAVHASEEQWSVITLCDLLVEVVLEEFLRFTLRRHISVYLLIINTFLQDL